MADNVRRLRPPAAVDTLPPETIEAISKLPIHMHASVIAWLMYGQPNPLAMGTFMRALLSNDLVGAVLYADDDNRREIHRWAQFLMSHVPSAAWGSFDRLAQWHMLHRAKKESDKG
jgi:hypothetical protein